MRILVLNLHHYILGGQEKVVVSETNYLKSLGHQVAVVALDHPLTIEDGIQKYFIKMDDIDQQKIKGIEPGLLTKSKYLFKGIHNAGSAKFFKEVIEDFKPEIIHSHSYHRYFSPSVFEVAKKYGIPIVTTEHDHKLTCPAYFFMKGWETYCKEELCINGNYLHCVRHKCFEKSLLKSIYYAFELYINRPRYLKNIDKIVVPSEYLYKVLRRSGIKADHLCVIKNFVDIDAIEPNYKPGDYYVYFGRISDEKGLRTLVRAFKDLSQLKLKIIGTGPLENELKQFIQDNGTKNIELVGYKSGNHLFKVVKNSKAVIQPSECAENAPMTILEAMACGKPIIGSNIGGIPELIRDKSHGLLFQYNHREDLVSAIQSIENMSDHAIEVMGKTNRKMIEEDFALRMHCKNLVDLYSRLIG